MKYRKGQSGNLQGRPKGIQDKRVALRALLEPHTPKLIDTVVRKALKGDMRAARILLDRIMPPLKTRDEPVEIGTLAGSVTDQARAVIEAVGSGRITPDQAASLMAAVSAQARIIEVDELERRVKAIEDKVGART